MEGHTINNDNEPVKENVVDPGPPPVGQWMKPTSCPRLRDGSQKVKGGVDQFPVGPSHQDG